MRKQFIGWLLFVFIIPYASIVNSKDLPSFSNLASKASPAVVFISTTRTTKNQYSSRYSDPFDEDFFRRFFESPNRGQQRERQVRSSGSGFIISEDGFLLTNSHVVEGSDEIIITLSDRREYKAQLVGIDNIADIALLKIEAQDLPTVKLGRSKSLQVGEWVVAIGSPFQLRLSVTAGIVSAKGRSIPNSESSYVPFIQTDVAINPGNSGGPLFNLEGEVVGINSQILTRSGGYMGVSFAIPIDFAMDVVNQLKAKGYVSRGWLGVGIQEVTKDLAESLGMEVPKGALIRQVFEGSPAEKAGIKERDVIIKFAETDIVYSDDLPQIVGTLRPGTTAKAIILRDGIKKRIDVGIGERADETEIYSQERNQIQKNKLGVAVRDLTYEEKSNPNIDQGVFVENIELDGLAAKVGIRKGDIITYIGNRKIKNKKEFVSALDSANSDKAISIGLVRNGVQRFLSLRLAK